MPLDVFIEEMNCRLDYPPVRGAAAACGRAVLLQITQRGKIMLERSHGIADALDGERRSQRSVNLLEHGDAVAYARIGRRSHVLRINAPCGIMPRQCATEMNPVDCPRLSAVGTVCMRHTSRQDKILVSIHLPALTLHFIPSFAVNTIYIYILLDRLGAAPVMMFGLGIITYVCDIQQRRQRICLHGGQNGLRQNYRPLAAESLLYFHGSCVSCTKLHIFL